MHKALTLTQAIFRVVFALGCCIAITSPVLAQPDFTDGKTCFCLRHEPTKQILPNCTGFKLPQDFYITAICRGLQPGDRPREILVQPPWTAIPTDSEGCEKCSIPRGTSDRPRAPDQ
jgi:hypothetical protein